MKRIVCCTTPGTLPSGRWPLASPEGLNHDLRRIIQLHLEITEPYPAVACCPLGTILLNNEAYAGVMRRLMQQGMRAPWANPANLYRLTFAPDGLLPFIENMYTLAPVAKRNALTDSDFHPDCVALFEALAAEHPELPFDADTTEHAGPLTERYRIDGQTISIYVLAACPARSMVPGEQIHIYSFLPADEPSRQFFVDLATHP